MSTQTEFWKEWHGSNELKRIELVGILTLPSKRIESEESYKHHCATLINSYLTDLAEYLEGAS